MRHHPHLRSLRLHPYSMLRTSFFSLLLLVVLPLAACDGGDTNGDGDGEPDSVSERVTWRVGSTTYTVSDEGADRGAILASYRPNTATPNSEGFFFSITALQVNSAAGVNVSGIVEGEGTYTYTLGDFTSVDVTTPDEQTYVGTSLDLTISRLTDTSVRGTFSFEAANAEGEQVQVTNGSFTIER